MLASTPVSSPDLAKQRLHRLFARLDVASRRHPHLQQGMPEEQRPVPIDDEARNGEVPLHIPIALGVILPTRGRRRRAPAKGRRRSAESSGGKLVPTERVDCASPAARRGKSPRLIQHQVRLRQRRQSRRGGPHLDHVHPRRLPCRHAGRRVLDDDASLWRHAQPLRRVEEDVGRGLAVLDQRCWRQ